MCTGTPLGTLCPPTCTRCQQICPGCRQQENHFLTLRLRLGPLQGSGSTSSLWKNRNDEKENKPHTFGTRDAQGGGCYVLVLVFGAADVRLVLFHGVQFDLADGALVALQCGSCRQVQNVQIFRPTGNFFLIYMGMVLVAVLGPGADDGPYVSISFCLVICLRCLLPT